jgi:hypothetical protein
VKSTVKGQDFVAIRLAVGIMIAARGFDRTFQTFSTGIGEEDLVGECCSTKALSQFLLTRNFVKIGDMPKLVRLIL